MRLSRLCMHEQIGTTFEIPWHALYNPTRPRESKCSKTIPRFLSLVAGVTAIGRKSLRFLLSFSAAATIKWNQFRSGEWSHKFSKRSLRIAILFILTFIGLCYMLITHVAPTFTQSLESVDACARDSINIFTNVAYKNREQISLGTPFVCAPSDKNQLEHVRAMHGEQWEAARSPARARARAP